MSSYEFVGEQKAVKRSETIKERIEREIKEAQAQGSARYAAENHPEGEAVGKKKVSIASGQSAVVESDQDHWRKHFEVSVFPKVGARDLADFLTLCDLRGKDVPVEHRRDYAWLHNFRQEWMLQFSSSDNRALLANVDEEIQDEDEKPDPEYVRGYEEGFLARGNQLGFSLNPIGDVAKSRVPESFQEMLDWLFGMNFSVMMDRQKKYGPGNIPKRGTSGTMTRMVDKFARLEFAEENYGSLENAQAHDLADESIEDTLIDIANYATIMRAQLRGWWTTKFCPPVVAEENA